MDIDEVLNNYVETGNTGPLPEYCLRTSNSMGTPLLTLYTRRTGPNASHPNGWYSRNIDFFVDIESKTLLPVSGRTNNGNYLQSDADNYAGNIFCYDPDILRHSTNRDVWFPIVSIFIALFIFFMAYKLILHKWWRRIKK